MIGGHIDGTKLTVANPAGVIKTHYGIYHRKFLNIGKTLFIYYHHETITNVEAIQKMFDNYTNEERN